MPQPIANSIHKPNLNNFKESTAPAEFLNLGVSVANPTDSIQEKPASFNPTQTNLGSRSLTPTTDLNTSTIKSYDEFSNRTQILNYFSELITLTYKKYNVEINSKFTRYIDKQKTDPSIHIKRMDLYYLLKNLSLFISIYLEIGYNEIIDIIDTLFKRSRGGGSYPFIEKKLMAKFIALTDKQIQEIASNKDLYKCLLVEPNIIYIDLNNIESVTTSRIKHNKRQEKKIHTFIDNSSADRSRKYLIRECIRNIFATCSQKNIDIDSNLPLIIKYLLNSKQLTNTEIEKILIRINFFFFSCNDRNTITDTSILTDIICYNKETTNDQLLLSICNITDEQIQFIASCKSKWKIIVSWMFKGFPATEDINKRINNFKKNNTTDNSTDTPVNDSGPQYDIIDLTEIADSPPLANNSQAAIALNSEQEKDDLYDATWLDDIPNFLDESNSTTKPELILSFPTKRFLDSKEQEDSQSKKPRLQ